MRTKKSQKAPWGGGNNEKKVENSASELVGEFLNGAWLLRSIYESQLYFNILPQEIRKCNSKKQFIIVTNNIK